MYPTLILTIQRIKWQQLMFGKGIVPLTTHQIARVERADRRRADKEKLQQVITAFTNPAFNLTPSLGPIRVDEGIVSPKLVKHPNSPENSQEEWDLEKINRKFLNLRKKKGIARRVILEKLRLFLTFFLGYKRYKKGICSQSSTPRGSSSNS